MIEKKRGDMATATIDQVMTAVEDLTKVVQDLVVAEHGRDLVRLKAAH
jgi:hypothetical protein